MRQRHLPVRLLLSAWNTAVIRESPRKLKHDAADLQSKLEVCHKKLKVTQQTSRRLAKKVDSLQDIISALEQKNMVSENCVSVLEKCLSGASLQLVLRQLAKHKQIDFADKQYPAELRAFALTLNFYSAKAYEFVRETFDLCLPHPKTLQKWYRSVDGNAGFSEQALQAVRGRAEAVGGGLVCALMMDEMAIRRQVEWDGQSYVGYVDLGTNVDDDSLPVAREALVFMIVSVTERWKIPVGYFLIDGLNGNERANLLCTCLSKLYEVGAHVVSVTFDGCSANLTMVSKLGCKLNSLTPTTSFIHPANDDKFVSVILDPCHMLKLLRNLLATKHVLRDENGAAIRWEYVEHLEKIQTQEGLRAGNRLTERHIKWTKQKMKVNIAAQTLSSSVADALEFCRDDLAMDAFADCAATVRYIRIIDRVFDLLNSRNPFAKGYKAPLRLANQQYWRPFINEAKSYPWELRLSTGDRVCDSNRKTGIIGLIVCLTSYCTLFDTLVAGTCGMPPPMKYLLGYKFSQDRIELFFCAVRGRGGWNNNPTARQFKAAYKRLLVHQNVKAVATGNCIPQEQTDLLSISSRIEAAQDLADAEFSVDQHHVTNDIVETDHDYSDIPAFAHLSMYVENVVVYVAGFVVRKLWDKVCCVECVVALTLTPDASRETTTTERELIAADLLVRKNRGGLLMPSADVVLVCKVCERAFITLFQSHNGKPPAGKTVRLTLVNQVMSHFITSDVFASLSEHCMDTNPLSDHRVRLMKLICNQYFTVRFFHAGKAYTQSLQGDKVWSLLSKTIIFKGQ